VTVNIHTPSPVASQRIADEIAARILDGRLAPGARIVQDEIADEFRASRLPVRDALRILDTRGLVTLKTNSGAWVSQMTMHDCAISYKVRERIEPLLLIESLPSLTADDNTRLLAIQEEIEATDDVERFLVLDREFHWTTYKRDAAPHLADLVARMWDTTQHYRRAFYRLTHQDRKWVISAEHRLLIEAVATNDGEAAENILSNHIRRSRIELARHPELFTTNRLR
jgi:DNA-binding GntR family transcriptional regulator